MSTDTSSMAYRMLGNTGLQVSVLSYGFWATFGAKQDLSDDEAVDKAKEILRIARAGGINLFDNAETYGSPRGAAEEIMGEALAQLTDEDPELWRRTDLLITTTIFWGGDGVNEKGCPESTCSRPGRCAGPSRPSISSSATGPTPTRPPRPWFAP